MNSPAALYVLRWLIRDTFRQAAASRLAAFMLAVSGITIAVCLSIGVSGEAPLERDGERVDFLPPQDPMAETARDGSKGVTVLSGELTICFGAIRVPLGRDGRDAVRFVQLLLAGGVADSLGVLLALIWTAGFLPTFLEASAAAVLLAKPTPRWLLLLGKYLGVLSFIALQAMVFIGGTWLALGLKTGIWDMEYLLCVPLLLLHFAVFFAVSTLLAACRCGPVACTIGSLLFWLVCWGMNYGRHAVMLLPESSGISSALLTLADAGYWLLPKPADFGMILFDALGAASAIRRPSALEAIDAHGAFHPLLAVLSSLVFALSTLIAAGRQFARTEY